MEQVHSLFLQAVRAGMEGREICWGEEITPELYTQLLELAQSHHVLPLFFETTYRCHAASQIEPERLQLCRRFVRQDCFSCFLP